MRLCDIPRDAKYFIVSEESYSDSYDSISFYLSFQFFKDKESFEAAVLASTVYGNSNGYKKPFKCGSIQLAEVHTEVRVDIK